MAGKEYTPALGYRFLTPAYDLAVGLLTRERRWRRELRKGIDATWITGFLNDDSAGDIGSASKVVSSLVFHQTPVQQKARLLTSMRSVFGTGGILTVMMQEAGFANVREHQAIHTVTGSISLYSAYARVPENHV